MVLVGDDLAPSFMTGTPVRGVGEGLADDRLSSMVLPRLPSSVSEAGCGGWLLNMNPKRPSVVGLLTTRSIRAARRRGVAWGPAQRPPPVPSRGR